MALTNATQLVEDVILHSIEPEDVLNLEEINQVSVWVVDAVESKEDAIELLQHGITCAITAFGMRFIGLRKDPYANRTDEHQRIQQAGHNASPARVRQAVQTAA